MKIVYTINQIDRIGGMERITIAKANALANIAGNEVWILVTEYKGYRPTSLSSRVHVTDLGIRYENNYKSGISYYLTIIRKWAAHKHKLKEVLLEIQPDVVVSTGISDKNFLPSIQLDKRPVFIREIHFFKHYRIWLAQGNFQKFIAKVADIYDYHIKMKHYDKTVVLTEEDYRDYWKCRKDMTVIPNMLTEIPTSLSTCMNKKVIAVGRLVPVKNFSSLIQVWKKVYVRHPDWTLEIWGDGPERNNLERQIHRAGLSVVVKLMGVTSQVLEKMADASLTAVTSDCEGFSLVLAESQSVGIPAVTYTFPCGPKDIIQDGRNGFLVPPHDEAAMAERICYLIEHPKERKRMGQTALEMSKRYAPETIAKRWMELFGTLQASLKK